MPVIYTVPWPLHHTITFSWCPLSYHSHYTLPYHARYSLHITLCILYLTIPVHCRYSLLYHAFVPFTLSNSVPYAVQLSVSSIILWSTPSILPYSIYYILYKILYTVPCSVDCFCRCTRLRVRWEIRFRSVYAGLAQHLPMQIGHNFATKYWCVPVVYANLKVKKRNSKIKNNFWKIRKLNYLPLLIILIY